MPKFTLLRTFLAYVAQEIVQSSRATHKLPSLLNAREFHISLNVHVACYECLQGKSNDSSLDTDVYITYKVNINFDESNMAVNQCSMISSAC